MYIRADLPKYTPQRLYKHEDMHDLLGRNRGMFLDMVEDLYRNHTQEEISRMVRAYMEATDGIYGDDEGSELKYIEEIICDEVSGMNRGGSEAAWARKVMGETTQRFAGDIENARQNRAGIERTNGPGQRFSNGGLDGPNNEVNWAVDEGIINWQDRKRLYEAIADIKKRGYNPRTPQGEYIIDRDNKFMFVGGSFAHPVLTRVIVLFDGSATRRQYARDYICKELAKSGRYDDARRYVEAIYGEGYAALYNASDGGRDAWEVQRGEGDYSGQNYQEATERSGYDEIDWIGNREERQSFSASEEDDAEDGLDGSELEEADSSTARDGEPVPYGAQNDNEETDGQITRAAETGERRREAMATAPEGPRNDKAGEGSAENGGPMRASAPTENAGGQIARATGAIQRTRRHLIRRLRRHLPLIKGKAPAG